MTSAEVRFMGLLIAGVGGELEFYGLAGWELT
jgi:hypothetical protein